MTTPHDAGRERDDRAAEAARFVERFAIDLAEEGFPRMSARVLAALLISPDASLSAAELAATIEVSPAAVSGAVRHLIAVGLVAREREPGSRRDRYRLLDDVWYESFVRAGDRFDRWATDLDLALAGVESDSDAARRLVEAREFFLFLRDQFPALMVAWRAHRDTRTT